MTQGSGYPAVKDTTANFDEPDDASAILNANLPNELASSVEAIQQTLGVDPLKVDDIGITEVFTGLGLMFRDLCRFEIGETPTWNNVTPEATQAVTTTSGRFTDLDSVVIFTQGMGQYVVVKGDAFAIELFTVYNPRTLTGGNFTFDIYRRITDQTGANLIGGSYTGAVKVRWLAVEWPH